MCSECVQVLTVRQTSTIARAHHVTGESVSMVRTHSRVTAIRVSPVTFARHKSMSVRVTLASLEDSVRTSSMVTSAAASRAPRGPTVRLISTSATAIRVVMAPSV